MIHAEVVKLVEPTSTLSDDFVAFCREFSAESSIPGIGSMDPANVDASLQTSSMHARGEGLPPGWVPAKTFWLVRDAVSILGTINLRTRLTPELLAQGGHIGYSVRPSERGRGYATHMLLECLNVARADGLRRLLVTCDRSNVRSIRVIEKAGGVLENEVASKIEGRDWTRRYWIQL